AMDEPVEDGIGKGRFAEVGVPFLHGQLREDRGGLLPDTIVEDFKEVSAVLGGGWSKSPVIERDEIGFGDLLEQSHVAAIGVRDAQLLEEPREAPVTHRAALPASLSGERAEQPALSGTGFARHQQPLPAADPLAASERGDQSLVELAVGAVG